MTVGLGVCLPMAICHDVTEYQVGKVIIFLPCLYGIPGAFDWPRVTGLHFQMVLGLIAF